MLELPVNTIVHGYARQEMQKWPAKSVGQGIVSPPYFQQRWYKSKPQVWGEPQPGGIACDHDWVEKKKKLHAGRGDSQQGGKYSEQAPIPDQIISTWRCSKCKAWLGEHGQEDTLQEYIDHEVEVYREFKRVLADWGTLWVVIGDKRLEKNRWALIPQRLQIAMEDDGWLNIMCLVWHKPNPMPNSSSRMFKPDFEFILVFAKRPDFYLDKNAVKTPLKAITQQRYKYPVGKFNPLGVGISSRTSPGQIEIRQPPAGGYKHAGHNTNASYSGKDVLVSDGKAHLGSVWTISTQSRFKKEYCPKCDALRAPNQMFIRCEKCLTAYVKGWKKCESCGGFERELCCAFCKNPVHRHYAMFPEPLVERMIKAGCPERVCSICGKPSMRMYKEKRLDTRPGKDVGKGKSGKADDPNAGLHNSELSTKRQVIIHTQTDQFEDSCDCANKRYSTPVVADFYMGFGTTGAVALRLGRNMVGVEPVKDSQRAATLRCQSGRQTGVQ